MTERHWARTASGLRIALVVLGGFFLVVYCWLALSRMNYPFHLEWMEGHSVDQAARVLQGRALYAKPSLEFVPFIYNPLYFYAGAASTAVLGVGFLSLRLLSFVASLACFLVIFLLARMETRSLLCGFLSCCLFAATFRLSGGWFDLARPDSVFLALFLGGIYVIRRWDSQASLAMAALLIWLSFLTKQTALVMSVPLALFFLARDRTQFMWFTGTLALACGLSALFLDWLHEGWYTYYISHLPNQFPVCGGDYKESQLVLRAGQNIWSYVTHDLMRTLGLAAVFALFYFLTPRGDEDGESRLFYFLAAVGMIMGAWFSKFRVCGTLNSLMPAHAALAILFGLGLGKAMDVVRLTPREARSNAACFVYLLCSIQFASLVYNPRFSVPTPEDLEAGRKVVAEISRFPGLVFVQNHPYLLRVAGKPGHALSICMGDVFRGDKGKPAQDLADEIRDAVKEKRFDAIFLDSDAARVMHVDIAGEYQRERAIFDNDRVFWPATGYQTRPTALYVRKAP